MENYEERLKLSKEYKEKREEEELISSSFPYLCMKYLIRVLVLLLYLIGACIEVVYIIPAFFIALILLLGNFIVTGKFLFENDLEIKIILYPELLVFGLCEKLLELWKRVLQ